MTALLLGGCASQQANQSSATATEAQTTPSGQTTTVADNAQFAKLPRLEGMATVVMVVKGQPITIEVDGTNAPVTAGNFVDLVQRGVYNGLVFHRVVREPQPFVVQGGDPQGKDPNVPAERLGTGSFIDPSTSRPRFIPLEIKPQDGKEPIYSQTFEKAGIRSAPALRHKRGAVAMARSAAPDSASAQFYFTLADLPFLDGSYAVFGNVTEGLDVIDSIERGDRIESAKVTKGAENLKTGS
ncbi:MAG TPA: peptidylprolyl isomerase [Halomicronema sp.]